MPESTQAASAHANAVQDQRQDAGPTPLAERRLAPGTRKTYDGALRRLDRWLGGRPLTDEALAGYLGDLFDRGLAAPSAATAVAAARDRARREGVASPVGPRTEAALFAFRRDAAGRGPGQVAGIAWDDADRMAELAEGDGRPQGLRDALLIRIMSDCLLRVSEAEALDTADIAFAETGLLVTLRRSKTDQEGRGAVLFAGPPAARLARCWLETAGIEEGPLFRPVNRAGRVADTRLTARSMRNVVRRRAVDAGIEGRVSGHSLRVGAAQSLRDRGATAPQLMAAGRWKRVDTMAVYTSAQDAAAGPVARLRYRIASPDGRGVSPHTNRKARRRKSGRRRASRERKRSRRASKIVEKRLAWIERAVVGS